MNTRFEKCCCVLDLKLGAHILGILSCVNAAFGATLFLVWIFSIGSSSFTTLGLGIEGICTILPAGAYLLMLKDNHSQEKRALFAKAYLWGYIGASIAFLLVWEIGNKGLLPRLTIMGIVYPIVLISFTFYWYLCLESYAEKAI